MSGRSRPVVIAERQVSLGDRIISCVVKRSPVARRIRLEIREGGVVNVILPRRSDLSAVDEMVQSKSRWVLRHCDRMAAQAALAAASGNGRLKEGDMVPYLGRDVRIETVGGAGAGGVDVQGDTLVIHAGGSSVDLEGHLERWYRVQALALLQRKVQDYAAALGVTCCRLSVRGQKSRWGSCSSKGTLSFNWRLVMAPEPVVDYVVIHELAHLKEMNHTRRFWDLVARHCPSWRERRQWLNDHGPELSGVLGAPR